MSASFNPNCTKILLTKTFLNKNNQSYLDIVGSAWNTLWHCSDSSGGSERFFDDERDTAADTVLGDHSAANVTKLFKAVRSN